jgi:hypothetical protein
MFSESSGTWSWANGGRNSKSKFNFYLRRFTMTYANNNAGNNQNNGQGNNGANSVTLLGCRLAGPGNYIPAYRKAGSDKVIQAQCKFAVYQNIRGKRLKFDITAWGKLADAIAKYGATGKEITIIGEMNSYDGRVWMQTPDGAPRQCYTQADGSPLFVTKVGITIKHMKLGNDSDKTVQEEISAGTRPQGWNDSRSPGKQQWLAICAERSKIQFTPGSSHFGYARVSLPQNGEIVASGNVANQAQNGGYNPNVGQAQIQQPVGGYNPQGGGYNQQPVAGGYNQQPVHPANNPNPGQPVEVNGQNMGYAQPQQPVGGYQNNPGMPQSNVNYGNQPPAGAGYGNNQNAPMPNAGYGNQPVAGGYQPSGVNM